VARELYTHYRKTILKSLSRGFPEWYKAELRKNAPTGVVEDDERTESEGHDADSGVGRESDDGGAINDLSNCSLPAAD
jgi:hypothetical protein